MTVGTCGKDMKTTGLIVRKGDPLVSRINAGLAKLKENGVLEAVEAKWYDGPCYKKKTKTGAAGSAAAVMFDTIVVAYLLSLTAFY